MRGCKLLGNCFFNPFVSLLVVAGIERVQWEKRVKLHAPNANTGLMACQLTMTENDVTVLSDQKPSPQDTTVPALQLLLLVQTDP